MSGELESSRLAAIEARIAISELRARYCWYMTRGVRDEVLALFTPDAIFETHKGEGEPGAARGQAELADYFSRIRPARRIPLVMNEITSINGDDAEGTCVMLGVGDDGFCGHYVDAFEKCDGQWKFKARRFYPYWPIYRPSPDRLHP